MAKPFRSSIKDIINESIAHEKKAIDADWETINKMDNARLVTTLAMICPFDPTEQQALLMAKNIEERAETIISLLEISTHETNEVGDARH